MVPISQNGESRALSFLMVVGGEGAEDGVEVIPLAPDTSALADCMEELTAFPSELRRAAGGNVAPCKNCYFQFDGHLLIVEIICFL